MVQTHLHGASPNAHLLIGQMPAPQAHGRWWEGTSLSIAAHAIVFGMLLYVATHVPQVVQTAGTVSDQLKIVFLNDPGRGGGGGGGGEVTTESPRRAVVAVTTPKPLAPVPNPSDTPPVPAVMIPVITVQAGQMLPGAFAQVDGTSLGRGTGPGGGLGNGPGSGPGAGPGLGDGRLGGMGGDAFEPGSGVTAPRLIREVKPNYTADAMRAKVQGVVEMEAVVLPDGSVDPSRVRIARSLDQTFGLDQQAIAAVKQWHFSPGTYKGQPVAVRVLVELTFTLR